MEKYTIRANESLLRTKDGKKNTCLQHDTEAYYHADYIGGKGRNAIDGTLENLICTFKNDIVRYSESNLNEAQECLKQILLTDLPKIATAYNNENFRICVIPRAKQEQYYDRDQKLFRQTIQSVIKELQFFEDGTHDIIRHTDTVTTHLSHKNNSNGGNGDLPYIGITKDTCAISDKIRDKNILLIDDLYTKTVGIDEDAIQALYENGARKVVFYSIGRTESDWHRLPDYILEKCFPEARVVKSRFNDRLHLRIESRDGNPVCIKKEDGQFVRFFPFAQGLELSEVVSLQNVEMCEKAGENGVYYLVQKK